MKKLLFLILTISWLPSWGQFYPTTVADTTITYKNVATSAGMVWTCLNSTGMGAWMVGGSVSIPAKQIPVGTGAGIVGSSNFTYDNTTLNFQIGQNNTIFSFINTGHPGTTFQTGQNGSSGFFSDGDTLGNVQFYVDHNANWTYFQPSGGNVGIGTATPAYLLDALGSNTEYGQDDINGIFNFLTPGGPVIARFSLGYNYLNNYTAVKTIRFVSLTDSINISASSLIGAVPYDLILPPSQGTGALTNDGSGNLSWTVVSMKGAATDSAVLSSSLTFNADSTYALHIAATIAAATFTLSVPSDGLQHQITIGSQAIITTITWLPAANIDGTVPTAATAKGLISLRWNPTTHKWQIG